MTEKTNNDLLIEHLQRQVDTVHKILKDITIYIENERQRVTKLRPEKEFKDQEFAATNRPFFTALKQSKCVMCAKVLKFLDSQNVIISDYYNSIIISPNSRAIYSVTFEMAAPFDYNDMVCPAQVTKMLITYKNGGTYSFKLEGYSSIARYIDIFQKHLDTNNGSYGRALPKIIKEIESHSKPK
jgi:hypothetical protein